MTQKAAQTPIKGDVILKTATHGEPADMFLLVLSPAEYNERTGSLITLFASAQEAHASNPFAIPLGNTFAAPKEMYALGNYPITTRWDEGSVQILGQASEEAVSNACETLNQIIEISS